MAARLSVDSLHRKPLGAFPAFFTTLIPPNLDALAGIYRAEFVGPSWLRTIAPHGLGLIHLKGWWGKEICADGTGTNLVRRGDRVIRSLPISVGSARSLLDGRPVIAVRYPPECPFPWPHVVDELRQLDPALLLGMTITNAGFLRRLPLPFVLHREERPHGL